MPFRTSLQPALLAIFALSGFSGLIYQSIWTQYLGLVLGHAAFAQTLVLAIYMGGLALGSWIASRRVVTLGNAVMAYAIVEAVIGLYAFVFHPVFVAYAGYSQATVLPHLAGASVGVYQWSTAALLILPQCILLGTTFPLMAAGCLRLQPDAQGRSLGGLYFTNSFGAAIGALTATFVLLPRIGMPGAMALAGGINLVVAAVAVWLARATAALPALPAPAAAAPESAAATTRDRRLVTIVLGAAAITGATSFMYEIVWVRMLNLVLGTTLHSFELMLAAFILGLAGGAYWIHRRGDAQESTLRLAGIVQVLMGLCALASALAFTQAFHWMSWLLAHVPRTDGGYAMFNLGSASIAMLVMFPTAFFAGATLPLFTVSLLRGGQGERSVGWVYAANTLGAIAGVLLVVHVMVPGLGLHMSLVLAALLDVVLGVVLLSMFGGTRAERDKRFALAAGLGMVVVALLFGRVDPVVQASGVFRTGRVPGPGEFDVLFLSDGKTATVSVMKSRDGHSATIATNGKPDAGMRALEYPPLSDEVTMVMAGALPLALHPAPRSVGVIGWGSGLTTHTLLGSRHVESVETIEIEPTMHQGARLFGKRVERAYGDPRSKVVFADARTYFAAGAKHYDVIVSEPSNPWVSGVAGLFTEEFYGFVDAHLNPDGLFVQWIQAYEMNDELVARIVTALLARFDNVEVYITNSSDLLVVASPGKPPRFDESRLQESPLREELARVGLRDAEAFALRRIGGREVLAAFARMQGGQGHSDYYPVVALRAPRARFLAERADMLSLLTINGMPVLDLLDGRAPPPSHAIDAAGAFSEIVTLSRYAKLATDALAQPSARDALAQVAPGLAQHLRPLLAGAAAPIPRDRLRAWTTHLAALARFGIGALPAAELQGSWIAPTWLAPGQDPALDAVMAAYAAAAARDGAAMQALATAVLDSDADFAPELREQMLTIAMTGAAGRRDRAAVDALASKYGPSMPQDNPQARVRRFLVAWTQGVE
jgi:spermidine synthase